MINETKFINILKKSFRIMIQKCDGNYIVSTEYMLVKIKGMSKTILWLLDNGYLNKDWNPTTKCHTHTGDMRKLLIDKGAYPVTKTPYLLDYEKGKFARIFKIDERCVPFNEEMINVFKDVTFESSVWSLILVRSGTGEIEGCVLGIKARDPEGIKEMVEEEISFA